MPGSRSPKSPTDRKKNVHKLRRISEEPAASPRSSKAIGMEDISRRIKLLQAARDLPAEHYLNTEITPLRAASHPVPRPLSWTNNEPKKRVSSHNASKSQSEISSSTKLDEPPSPTTPYTSQPLHARQDSALEDQCSEELSDDLEQLRYADLNDDDDTLQASDTPSPSDTTKVFDDVHTTNEPSAGSESAQADESDANDSADETLYQTVDEHFLAASLLSTPKTPGPVIHKVESEPPDDDDAVPAPIDLSQRGIHIPSRTSSKAHSLRRMFSSNRSTKSKKSKSSGRTRDSTPTGDSSIPTTPQTARSYAGSTYSYETAPTAPDTTSLHTPQEQTPRPSIDRMAPVLEDDPQSFDLVAPTAPSDTRRVTVERLADHLFSRRHLEEIFADTVLFKHFSAYLTIHRPKSVPMLVYYLDAIKSIRAINYANAVAEALEPIIGHEFTDHPARPTINSILEDKARQAFDVMVEEDLPAYITHVLIRIASGAIEARIIHTQSGVKRRAAQGLADVFCLSDPSRTDNPIVFASEEFHRITQYGASYVGQNCRFLQGPRTNSGSLGRLREAVKAGKEVTEVVLNYRRDGSPFLNLLMLAPLCDSRGTLRYFIGAQIDVSSLVTESPDLKALGKLLEKDATASEDQAVPEKDEFRDLTQMFNDGEMHTVRKHGGRMHYHYDEETEDTTNAWRSRRKSRVLLSDMPGATPQSPSVEESGKLQGAYQNYLLLRPSPSLRILFTSPSLRIPGILQSPFLDRIGGSSRIRDQLSTALSSGSSVTAKVKWLTNPRISPEEGRNRWIHCTPLLGANGNIGAWMVLLIDEETAPVSPTTSRNGRFKDAPPVDTDIRISKRSDSASLDDIPMLSTPDPTSYHAAADLFPSPPTHTPTTGQALTHHTLANSVSSPLRPRTAPSNQNRLQHQIEPDLLSLESLPTLSAFSSQRGSFESGSVADASIRSIHPRVQTVQRAHPHLIEKRPETSGDGERSRQASMGRAGLLGINGRDDADAEAEIRGRFEAFDQEEAQAKKSEEKARKGSVGGLSLRSLRSFGRKEEGSRMSSRAGSRNASRNGSRDGA